MTWLVNYINSRCVSILYSIASCVTIARILYRMAKQTQIFQIYYWRNRCSSYIRHCRYMHLHFYDYINMHRDLHKLQKEQSCRRNCEWHICIVWKQSCHNDINSCDKGLQLLLYLFIVWLNFQIALVILALYEIIHETFFNRKWDVKINLYDEFIARHIKIYIFYKMKMRVFAH